jgi:hypothetical protein
MTFGGKLKQEAAARQSNRDHGANREGDIPLRGTVVEDHGHTRSLSLTPATRPLYFPLTQRESKRAVCQATKEGQMPLAWHCQIFSTGVFIRERMP